MCIFEKIIASVTSPFPSPFTDDSFENLGGKQDYYFNMGL